MDDVRNTKEMVFDVVVIGAGIEGSAAAYYSARDGRRVLLLEQYSLPHTRGSSHGGSRITRLAESDERFQKFSSESYALWEELEKETKTELLRKVGMLLISNDGWEDGYPNRVMQSMVKSGAGLERIAAEEANIRIPNFKHSADSELCIYQHAGYIRANKALHAFQGEFVKRGGVLHDEEKMLEIVPGAMVTVKTNRSEYQTRSVILAPGPWASTVIKQLGLNISLQVHLAYHIFWKERVQGTYAEFPVFNDLDRDGIAYSGCPSNEYPGLMKIGKWMSTPIDDPDSRDQTDEQQELDVLRDYIREHFPGLDADNGPAIKEACLVTEAPDQTFIIDVHPSYSNIAIGCAFAGGGFMYAPIVGRLLSQLAEGVQPQLDISLFSISRFEK
ncbi:peroxisomal sarcosine oxidase-like [Lytechinus pictus]|uniref:peroxisomal sarcosine oxidase-like n=1 Tax=Lytechinus pictus TaxID=7653 RepID=UPI0030B9FA59